MRLVRDENGQVRLLAMLDDDGNVIFDLRCPILCGECCGEWKNLTAFRHFMNAALGLQPCPHLGPLGCKLPRKKRPIECTVFLCELALLSLHGMLTDEERDRVLACHRQHTAFAMLGKMPEPGVDLAIERAKIRSTDRNKIDKLFRKGSLNK